MLLAIFLLLPSYTSALNISEVSHGILVTAEKPLYQISDYAEVYVVVDADNYENFYNEHFQNTLRVIRNRVYRYGGPSAALNHIETQREIMDEQMKMLNVWKRKIIDSFGVQIRFGLASDIDIQNLDGLPGNSTYGNIFHYNSRLIGLTNDIYEVEEKLSIDIDSVGANFREIPQAEIANMSIVSLDYLKRHLQIYIKEIFTLSKQRIACESGKVTRDLLHPKLLKASIDSSEMKLPLEWYYENLKIEYMFEYNNSLICNLRIPLIGNTEFRIFSIHSFPFRKGNGYVQIYRDIRIAISNLTVTYANECISEDPLVCNVGSVFSIDEFPCLSGLVFDRKRDQLECPVVYYSNYTVRNELMKVNLYQYFGFLENVSYTYHCPGKYPVVDTIKNAAIYVITVDVDCYFNPSEDVIDEFRDKSSTLHVPVLLDEISWNYLIEEIPRVKSIHWNSIQEAMTTMNIYKTKWEKNEMDQGQLLMTNYVSCWFSLMASASLCIVSFCIILPALLCVIRRYKNSMLKLYNLIVTNQTALLEKM